MWAAVQTYTLQQAGGLVNCWALIKFGSPRAGLLSGRCTPNHSIFLGRGLQFKVWKSPHQLFGCQASWLPQQWNMQYSIAFQTDLNWDNYIFNWDVMMHSASCALAKYYHVGFKGESLRWLISSLQPSSEEGCISTWPIRIYFAAQVQTPFVSISSSLHWQHVPPKSLFWRQTVSDHICLVQLSWDQNSFP